MLLEFTDKGIYCPKADVYIDPWKPVRKALITHGHADHSRWGHQYYLSTVSAMPVIKYRLGNDINIETVTYGQIVTINGVHFSFHPAGHIIGSAQIRVEYNGEVWVVSGDYKVEDDGLSEAFEPVKCHTFITESTFGLPIYSWLPQQEIFSEINSWWKQNKEQGKVTVLSGYALGKAQRLIQGLDDSIGRIFTHGAVENVNEIIRGQGVNLKPTTRVTPEMNKGEFEGGIVIATPSARGSPWMKKFLPYSVGVASGWMRLRGARRRRSVDRGFSLSDHADWNGLNQAVEASQAERVFVTHGYTTTFSRWLNEKGIEAARIETQFEGELEEIGEGVEKDAKSEGKDTAS
ncbi:ligase-associated DNA damage response exonuclease [Fulvivirga kasyanovii]|uniref:Ligase-associated DNA damage response exonuclease n=1 Tax=Fulvivirga kasyanovii TaxID=396812 RepID=A0ABW9RXC6_9BACT|nr:ligase-associated DNA damage response exonuclease [Fulvivirga kasyanovii]MTI28346.1 ligase-associated DNA damage response exonuclease [Fulvivirga kasyanovii]